MIGAYLTMGCLAVYGVLVTLIAIHNRDAANEMEGRLSRISEVLKAERLEDEQ
jgi:hypothetical protein